MIREYNGERSSHCSQCASDPSEGAIVPNCRDLLSDCFEKYGKLTEGALNLKYDTISSMDPSKLEGTFSDFHSAPASTVWRPNQI